MYCVMGSCTHSFFLYQCLIVTTPYIAYHHYTLCTHVNEKLFTPAQALKGQALPGIAQNGMCIMCMHMKNVLPPFLKVSKVFFAVISFK